jgi:DNA-binding response OmpR family regulator
MVLSSQIPKYLDPLISLSDESFATNLERTYMNGRFHIMVLDDEAEILEVVHEMLKDVPGIIVSYVKNADEGIRVLPLVDAVIADCVFPDSKKFDELLAKMSKPVIRMSGKVDRATNLEIPKPFNKRQLVGAIDMLRFFHAPVRGKGKKAA